MRREYGWRKPQLGLMWFLKENDLALVIVIGFILLFFGAVWWVSP